MNALRERYIKMWINRALIRRARVQYVYGQARKLDKACYSPYNQKVGKTGKIRIGVYVMPYYREMYYLLFNAVTDAIEQIDKKKAQQAKITLINAQKDAEELFLCRTENETPDIDPNSGDDGPGNLRIIK